MGTPDLLMHTENDLLMRMEIYCQYHDLQIQK